MAYQEIDPTMLAVPYSAVAFKASHNSYDIAYVSLAEQLPWDPADPSKSGCRGIELDIAQQTPAAGPWQWSVNHNGSYDDDPDMQLSAYLKVVVDWSTSIAGQHGPLLIHIDLKSALGSDSDFPAQIDAYITKSLPGMTFYRADALLRGKGSLLDGVKAGGWPTLQELAGKVLVCLTGDMTARTDAYIASLLATKSGLCFCDIDISDDLSEGTPIVPANNPNRLLLNFDARTPECTMPNPAAIPDCNCVLLRGYALPINLWPETAAAGTNVLAVDVPKLGSMNVTPPLYAKAAR